MSRPLRAVLWRYRWLIVALCLACAAWITIGELRPPPPAGVSVLVAATDLAAGAVVAAADVEIVELPAAPAGAVMAEAAVGFPLTISVPRGLPIVKSMLLAPGLVDSAPPGWVVVPVPLADPVLAQLLRVGDRVDLYLAASDSGGRIAEAELVATAALVLARDAEVQDSASLLGSTTPQGPAVIVVAIAAGDAAGLTGASGFGPFRAVLAATH